MNLHEQLTQAYEAGRRQGLIEQDLPGYNPMPNGPGRGRGMLNTPSFYDIEFIETTPKPWDHNTPPTNPGPDLVDPFDDDPTLPEGGTPYYQYPDGVGGTPYPSYGSRPGDEQEDTTPVPTPFVRRREGDIRRRLRDRYGRR